MNIRRTIAVIVLAAAIGIVAFSGIKLRKINQVYMTANDAYEKLSRSLKTNHTLYGDTNKPNNSKKALHYKKSQNDIPDINIDFEALKKINDDSTAWLYCPDTVIDYPVMRADDYDYYLHHLPDGTQNANGTLFIDYNCASDFSDTLSIIYGHNMRSKSMFGSLGGYKKQDYFDKHPYMYLYTQHGNYRIELIYGCVIGSGQWREQAFMYKENIDSLINYAAYNTTFTSSAVYDKGDRIVAMSTCSYEFDDARYVVIGILREE